MLNVHYEACPNLHRTVQSIKQNGMKAAVTLNPHSPVSLLEDIIVELDMVLLMSVNPGYGGQKFIENSYSKISRLREMITRKNLSTLIEVDGGVNEVTAPKLFACGADVLVAGSHVFSSSDPLKTISDLKAV
jgi:ribulose-phosphate 3-epimerase